MNILHYIKEVSPLLISILVVYLTYRFALKQAANKTKQELYSEIYALIIECAKNLDKIYLTNPNDEDADGVEFRKWYDEADNKVVQAYHKYLKYSLYFNKKTDSIISEYLTNFVIFYNENKCFSWITGENEKRQKLNELKNINDNYIKPLLINKTEINFNNKLKKQLRKDLGL